MSKWLFSCVSNNRRHFLKYRVQYEKSFVAEIVYSEGHFEIIDRNGVKINHDVEETWTDSCGNFEKETLQRLLFAIKNHMDSCFCFIEYEIE